MTSDLLVVAVFGAVHGVHGRLLLRPYNDSLDGLEALKNYGQFYRKSGTPWPNITFVDIHKEAWLVSVEGFTDRTISQTQLTGRELYIQRSQLPETEEDTFYHNDLVGLKVLLQSGSNIAAPPYDISTIIGTVQAVHNFGAGDILELRLADGSTAMIPFTKACCPMVDLQAGTVVVEAACLLES